MSSGPANAVMDRGPSRPAAGRQRIDVSLDDKRILEAASRTPAVLEDLNIQWHMTPTVVKPVVAKVADIGAAALRKLLGTVEYLGPPFAEQVDITRWCLPDRTTGPVPKRRRGAEEAAEPVLQLPSGLRAAVGAVIDHARGTAQQASEAMAEAVAAARLGEETLRAAETGAQREAALQDLCRRMQQAHAEQLERQRAEAEAQHEQIEAKVQGLREQLEQHRVAATAAQLIVDNLSGQQCADAMAVKFVAGAATTEAESAQKAREAQSYESKKEHQQLDRRDEALKKAMAALESATVRARVRARGACPYPGLRTHEPAHREHSTLVAGE